MSTSKKRDLINEITSIQSRVAFKSRGEYSTRLKNIENALLQIASTQGRENQELLRYIPISTVACIQSFFRFAIKEIIDSGEPFNKNVANYKDKVKPPDYDIIAAIQTKTFTIGEFVAHSLSYNSYENIDSNIKHLLEDSLTNKLLSHSKKSIHDSINKRTDYFKNHFLEIKKNIDTTFQMRHTFCHEFATKVKIEAIEIKKYFNDCKVFLEYADEVISNIIYPNYAETQLDMNKESLNSYTKKDNELSNLIDKIKCIKYESVFPWNEEDNKDFDLIQEKWKEYRDFYASTISSKYKGGSIRPLMHSSAMELITEERIQGLKNHYRNFL